jgi:hypothetical protein
MMIEHSSRRVASSDAYMSVIERGRYVNYYASAAALAVIEPWNGVALVWEVDDTTHRPIAVHLKPGGSLAVRKNRDGRTHVTLPTSKVGLADSSARPQVVEESISDNEIVVRIPSTFWPETVEATQEAM